MTQIEIDQLFEHNTEEINKLNIASGSMIKALIQGISANGNIYIRLSGATEGGHKVSYAHIEGDQTLIVIIGKALGLTVTDNTLGTRNA